MMCRMVSFVCTLFLRFEREIRFQALKIDSNASESMLAAKEFNAFKALFSVMFATLENGCALAN